MRKRGAVIAAILAMTLGLSACGQKGTENGGGTGTSKSGSDAVEEARLSSKEYVYKQTLITPEGMPKTDGTVYAMRYIGDRLHIFFQSYEGDGYYLASFGVDGSDQELTQVPVEAYVGYATLDEVGDLYLTETSYVTMVDDYVEEENAEPADIESADDAADNDEAEYSDAEDKLQADADEATTFHSYEYDYDNEVTVYQLKKFDGKSGELVYTVDLGEDATDPDDYWPMGIGASVNVGVMIADPIRIDVFDIEEGFLTAQLETGYSSASGITARADGAMVVRFWEDYGEAAYEYLPEENKLSDKMELPKDLTIAGPGVSTDFIAYDGDGVYTCNSGDTTGTKIMDFVGSDLDVNWPSAICQISDTEFVMCYYNDSDTYLALFTKVDPADVKDKIAITLGGEYINWDIRKQAIKFNQNSDTYHISFVDYSQYNTEEAYEAEDDPALKQLNNDIISGNAPDMLILDTNMPVESYYAKGLFEDLDSYLAEDADIQMDDYMVNVFDALRYKEKLYSITPAFTIFTVAGKKSVIGTHQSWSIADLETTMEVLGFDAGHVFGDMRRDTLLYYTITLSGNDYIDWENGECHFDSEEFKELLTFIKQFPEEYDYSEYEYDDTAMLSGTQMLEILSLYNYRDYNRTRQGELGGDMLMVGFPTASGTSGTVIYPSARIAMNANAADKEGCWQFMRSLLLDEYQENIVENGYELPVSKSALDQMAKAAMEKPYYEDEDGKKVEYDDLYYIGGEEITITPLTQEDIDFFNDFIGSVTSAFTYNREIVSIIEEEAAPFFADQKSVDDVTQIMQSKIKIYVNENS